MIENLFQNVIKYFRLFIQDSFKINCTLSPLFNSLLSREAAPSFGRKRKRFTTLVGLLKEKFYFFLRSCF